ncbi:MAG TPA: ribonuclease H-like YkuK family protein [Candidatus Paceibacterota bacterium]|nr:ribonuclease H-like YkuK family protein [Candidatus Paceibacterota bacterium]HOV88958.1 ribonuclease H-like YkuK family protein [Candidatus Paceibacterota bacterium]
MEKLFFKTAENKKIELPKVVKEIFSFIQEKPQASYKLVIGSDSLNAADHSDFVTAIIILRVGNGGRYFWRRITEKNFKTLRERIYKEVYLSLELAQELLKLLVKNQLANFDLEIHVDVGQNGETRNLINEVAGLVRGCGFAVKTKPESFAASNVADRCL